MRIFVHKIKLTGVDPSTPVALAGYAFAIKEEQSVHWLMVGLAS